MSLSIADRLSAETNVADVACSNLLHIPNSDSNTLELDCVPGPSCFRMVPAACKAVFVSPPSFNVDLCTWQPRFG